MAQEEFTKEEIEIIKEINQLEHFEMCRLWRFEKTGHIYFDKSKPFAQIFYNRLFGHFGGFTPAISKRLGFTKSDD